MTDIVEIHVAGPSPLEARKSSHRLLDDRGAACCNIPSEEMDSRFWS